MEEDQGLRFICKLCYKKYPCGKSLGGHMRSYVIANSAQFDEKLEANMKNISSLGVVGEQNIHDRIKDCRIWRDVDSTFPLPQARVCKQCGKRFQSLKALCGHMACHSERDRGLKDDHSWTSEYQKMVLDSYSDTEEADDQRLRTRSSKSKMCKKYQG